MRDPGYKLSIGKKQIDTTTKPQASSVVDLTIDLDLDTPADSATIVFGNVDGLKPERGDQVSLELGYADDGGFTTVFTGAVVAVEPGFDVTRVWAFSAADDLIRTYVDQTYESKTAGEIVSTLAAAASVPVATADDGISFPAYVVDGRRPVYRHMRDLAELSGFDVYLDADGKLVFESFSGGKTIHILEYAKQLVALDVLRRSPLADMVEAWGESPTDSQGANAWSWLISDFSASKGTAGSGTSYLLERPALRTSTAAGLAATAALTEIQRRTVRGWLLTLGNAAIQLGDAVELKSVPDNSLNDKYQVRSVRHRIAKHAGFTTRVGFRAIQV